MQGLPQPNPYPGFPKGCTEMPLPGLPKPFAVLAAFLLAFPPAAFAGALESADSPVEQDISTVLMQSTFEITGPGAHPSVGTGFVVAKPGADPSLHYYVLVTANHILDGIAGPEALLWAREKEGENWRKIPLHMRIRDPHHQPLWVKHPAADVAVMYVDFPPSLRPERVVSTAWFADDHALAEFEVRPGDPVFILGYPFGTESSEGGFPVLRAGWIASYPLLPSRSIKKFLVSFEVFPGNSGGPVYLLDYNRVYAGATHMGSIHFLIGLVSEQVTVAHEVQELYGTRKQNYPLHVAVVVPASLIADTIAMLPVLPSAASR